MIVDARSPRRLVLAVGLVTALACLAAAGHAAYLYGPQYGPQPACPEHDLFSSQCKGPSAYFLPSRGIKGSCCLRVPAGATVQCHPNTWSSDCRRPGDNFMGTAKGTCCAVAAVALVTPYGHYPAQHVAVAQPVYPRSQPFGYPAQPVAVARPVIPQPTCVQNLFSSSCKTGAFLSYRGSIKGDCCVTPPPGYTFRCTPNVFSSRCRRPGDTFIGSVTGACCAAVPAAGVVQVVG